MPPAFSLGTSLPMVGALEPCAADALPLPLETLKPELAPLPLERSCACNASRKTPSSGTEASRACRGMGQ
eukprot:scaffold4321_cov33-Tisochrysis_lutea.AAC.8